MNIWEAIIMGIIQGLTEFLPVSSSGHLELANHLFGIDEPNNLQFTVAVHCATVISTIVIFRRDIWNIICGLLKWQMNDETKFVINIAVSLIPIMVVGLFFKDQVESMFTGNILLVGSMLLVTAALLTFTHFAPKGTSEVTPMKAFVIGIAQSIAVLPGMSRSGSTIATGLLLGIKREKMAQFSFLMVLIPILGMTFLDLISGEMGADSGVSMANIAAGFVAAFVSGLMACKFMIKIVNRGKLIWFAIYCAIVGVISIGSYLFA